MLLDSRMFVNEQARLIFQTAPASAITHLIVVAFLYPIICDVIDTNLLTIWTVVISCLAISRFILYLSYKKTAPDDAKPWLNAFTALTLLVGISWASFTFFYLTVDDTTYKVIFLALTCSIVAAATPVLSAWTPAYYANTIPQFFGIIFVLIYSSEATSYFLAGAFVIFYLMLSSVQRSSNKNILHSFQLQHKNDELVEELHSEIVQREQIIKEKTQEAIGEHQRFQIILEGVSAISVQGYDENRKVIFWNKASEKIYGYSREEAIGKQLEEFIIPVNMRSAVIAAQQAWLKEGIAIPSSELKLLHKNGSDVDVFSSHVMITKNDGSKEMFCIDIDVTARKYAENELKTSESRLKDAMTYARIGHWELLIDQKTAHWSEEMYHLLGLSLEIKPSPESLSKIVNNSDFPTFIESIKNAFATGHEHHLEYQIIRLDDGQEQERWIECRGKLLTDKDGNPTKISGFIQDITERKVAEEALQLSARVFSDTHEGISITDSDKIIIDVNPAFCDITGYSRDEVIGQNSSLLSSGKQSPKFYQDMWQQVSEQGHWQGEVWNRKKSGELYAELLTISVINNELNDIVNYIGVFTDITSNKQQQEKLNLMAHYDELTGLPNRSLFTDRFTQAVAHSKRTNHQLAICFLDLDNFKPVNDSYGHDIGDKLLIEVAVRIASCIREEDTVSRQGGDEFALILNDIESFYQCEQTLQRIHHSLAQPFIIDGHPHKITASSGLTLYPNDNGDIDTLLRHADQAMYQAKLAGKHRYQLYNPEQDQLTIQKHHQLNEIEQALANNEFQLYYQPKVNMVTGNAFGAEALIRWIHPEKGLIPPLDFLSVVEGTELELKISNWVLNEALTQLEVWHQQGLILEISVNISSYHLLSETFFSDLDAVLAKHPSVDSQYLQIEILESSALGDLNIITTVIETCQNGLGIKVALDDFGTGYSSLTHLRSLPVNTIKIDQSFVRDMLEDPNDYAIIDGIIGLSDAFNREVIAEGVETTNHGLMLLVMGCEKAQGYGIAKPMPADDYPQWLNDYTPNQEWLFCGSKYRTVKENKVKLFRLITDRWKDQFISNIQSSAEGVKHWPIMHNKRCPCGSWIKRAKQEQLFEPGGLKQLSQTHENLHLIAQALQLQYQADNIDAARKGLNKFQNAFDEVTNALGICE